MDTNVALCPPGDTGVTQVASQRDFSGN